MFTTFVDGNHNYFLIIKSSGLGFHFHFLSSLCLFYCFYLHREAVRQRKALSRTSSNILLNSVQMGHNAHNLSQYNHIPYNISNDYVLNSKLNDLTEENSQHSISNIEVCILLSLKHYL